jgi:tetraacyldisaccharide-1-P 4'-kinase
VAGERNFPDHHVYNTSEVEDLEHAAAICGADALLCTEKDVWNLRHAPFTAMPVYCCRISVELPVEEFRGAISHAVSRRQKGIAR